VCFFSYNTAEEEIKVSLFKLSHVEQTFIHFLTDMYINSAEFSELCNKNEIMDGFIEILFPIVCACDEVSIETELYSKNFGVEFDINAAFETYMNSGVSGIIPILISISKQPTQYIDDEPAEEMTSFSSGSNLLNIITDNLTSSPLSSSPLRASPLQSDTEEDLFNIPKIIKAKKPGYTEHKNAAVESLLEFIVSICVNSIVDLKTKPPAGLEILLRVYIYLLIHYISCFLFFYFTLKDNNKSSFQSFPPSLLEHQVHKAF
jgi:hypothetical protein